MDDYYPLNSYSSGFQRDSEEPKVRWAQAKGSAIGQ